MAVEAAAANNNNNNNNNVDASNKAELPSLQDLNNETVDLVITSFHCFFFHVAAMSKMVTSCLVSFQPRLILARSSERDRGFSNNVFSLFLFPCCCNE